jgi:hypothetical protein
MNTTTTKAARAVRRTLDAILAAGWTLAEVNDGEEWELVTDLDAALALIMNVDDAAVGFDRYNEAVGRTEHAQIIFVPYNDPAEIIHDNTLNLEPALDTLTELTY